MTAHYQCLKCKYEWDANPGMQKCPKCGNLYVKWTNYAEFEKRREVCK